MKIKQRALSLNQSVSLRLGAQSLAPPPKKKKKSGSREGAKSAQRQQINC